MSNAKTDSPSSNDSPTEIIPAVPPPPPPPPTPPPPPPPAPPPPAAPPPPPPDQAPTEELPAVPGPTALPCVSTLPEPTDGREALDRARGPRRSRTKGLRRRERLARAERRQSRLRRHLRRALAGVLIAVALLTGMQLFAAAGISQARQAALAQRDASSQTASTSAP